MGVSLNPPHARQPEAAALGARRLLRVLSLVRYRFFLYAGLLPFVLGAAWAFRMTGTVDPALFFSGLGGVVLAVIGVEAFNEYFDSRMGTDRVFNPVDLRPMSVLVLLLGIAGFAGAAFVGIYLTGRAGWPIVPFAVLGGLAAVFYVAPPIRWAYRGLGETVIGLSYGPWMVLGSLYLLAGRLSWEALAASLVPGLLIMALAVVNAIPDFHQDRLVGKRNLVVRLGRRKAVGLYLLMCWAAFGVIGAGVAGGIFPVQCLLALAGAPYLIMSSRAAVDTYERPRLFIPAIRRIVTCYVVTVIVFTVAIISGGGPGLPE